MRKFYVLFVLFLTVQNISAQTTAKKTGVICFGNAAYQNDPDANVGYKFQPLPFTVNDVTKIENFFVDLKVDKVIDPFLNMDTKSAILTAIKSAEEILNNEGIDQIVFYYSGHGIEERYRNFIIPTNFKVNPLASKILPKASPFIQAYITRMQLIANNSVELDFVSKLNYFNLIQNAVPLSEVANSFKNYQTLVISDACRNSLPQPNKRDNFNASKYNFIEVDIRDEYKYIYKKKLSKKQIKQYLNELEMYKREMEKTIAQFDSAYNYFENSITEKLIRKPLTILFATSTSTKAGEEWTEKGGLFTASFLAAAKSDKVTNITFNEAFLETVKDSMLFKNINSVQTPNLKGSQSFTLPNPFYKKKLTLLEFRELVANSLLLYNSLSNLTTQTITTRMSLPPTEITKVYNPFVRDTLELFAHKNDTLSVGRYSYYDFDNQLNSISGNYQIETTLSFATVSDTFPDQYFFWDGYFAETNQYGYHLAPFKEGDDYYIGYGHWDYLYNQNPRFTYLNRYKLPSTDSLPSKTYAKNNLPLKITIRRYNNEFFFFIDEKFVGRAPDVVNKKYGRTIFSNKVGFAINTSDTSLEKPYLNQLNYGNIITMTPVVVKEIKENLNTFNIEKNSYGNRQ